MNAKPYQPGVVRKCLAFWGLFMLFYGIYKAAPVFPLSIFCAIDESNFQHYKATFFALVILAVIEYLIFHKRIGNKTSFFYSRAAAALIAPWFILLMWYIAPALYGKMPSVILEIVYANVMTLAVGFMVVIFEKGLYQINYSKSLKTVIWVLLVVSMMLYMIFTFVKLPWADVFIEPEWKESAFLLWRLYV